MHLNPCRYGGERLVRVHGSGHDVHRAQRHRVRVQAEREPALGHRAEDARQSHRQHDII